MLFDSEALTNNYVQSLLLVRNLRSLEHPVKDYTIFIGNDTTPNDVIRSAILDPLSWISPFFKKARNNGI